MTPLLKETLGQFFTPEWIVKLMLALKKNDGRTLEPACGNGAFLHQISNCVGIEYDTEHCPTNALNMDFFDYPITEKFDTIIGNPPYLRFREIPQSTQQKLDSALLNQYANLYLFFIEKALKHLNDHGELIFITPRDFLKSTSATRLNQYMLQLGTFTEVLELGDRAIFTQALPNCLIWRFEKTSHTRSLHHAQLPNKQSYPSYEDIHWQQRILYENSGHLMFAKRNYPLRLKDIAFVKVGAASGADNIFWQKTGNRDFIYSQTYQTGQTRRMIWNQDSSPPNTLLPFKEQLMKRRIRQFTENNWWHWGRSDFDTSLPRIYVNSKTRQLRPFFIHPCRHYDGSVLAIFPLQDKTNLQALCDRLNGHDWDDTGFICDHRFIFSQRSLENAPLSEDFIDFLP